MSNQVDRNTFWNKKIINWEKDKYSRKTSRFVDVNSSVKYRMHVAEKVICSRVEGKHVIEVGCGSALLMPKIIQSGAKSYTGIDISDIAIKTAQETAVEIGISDKVNLFQGDVVSCQETDTDIIFSLGLLDWLNPDEIKLLNNKLKGKFYLHSFSRKSLSVQQLFHKAYVHIMYGHSSNRYVPIYYTEEQIRSIFESNLRNNIKFYSDEKLSFGSFVYDLPNLQGDFPGSLK